MDRSAKRLGLALALSLFAVACAAPTIPNDTTSEEDPNEADSDITGASPSKTPKKTSTPKNETGTTANPEADPQPGKTPTPTPTPSPSPTPAPNDCAQQQGDACFDCCDQASGGTLAKADQAFGDCACTGACASACGASFCNGAQPTAACDACLTQTCEPAADALCTSAACKAGQQCAQQCQ